MDQHTTPPDGISDLSEQGTPRGGVRVIAAIMAVLATISLLLVALFGSVLIVQAVQAQTDWMTVERVGVVALALMQLLLIAGTLMLARTRGSLVQTLALRWPSAEQMRAVGRLVLVMVLLLGGYTLAAFWLTPDLIKQDLASFRPLLASDVWWIAVAAVVIGAPLSEELLFRGFLLGELIAARLATVAAVLIPNLLWTALHFQYSLVGLGEVFLAGLLLSWSRLLANSALVPIALHVIYNLIALAVMVAVIG